MSDKTTDNVRIKPTEKGETAWVATDVVGGVHYPVYKLAYGQDGDAALLSHSSKLPVSDSYTVDVLGQILKQLKIMNMQLSLMTDTTLTREDI